MNKEVLNIALPKGRLGEKVLSMLEAAGYVCPAIHEGGRRPSSCPAFGRGRGGLGDRRA